MEVEIVNVTKRGKEMEVNTDNSRTKSKDVEKTKYETGTTRFRGDLATSSAAITVQGISELLLVRQFCWPIFLKVTGVGNLQYYPDTGVYIYASPVAMDPTPLHPPQGRGPKPRNGSVHSSRSARRR